MPKQDDTKKVHYFSTRMDNELNAWLEAVRADMAGIGNTPLFRQLIHDQFKRRKLKVEKPRKP